jgi:hypothetical protein
MNSLHFYSSSIKKEVLRSFKERARERVRSNNDIPHTMMEVIPGTTKGNPGPPKYITPVRARLKKVHTWTMDLRSFKSAE